MSVIQHFSRSCRRCFGMLLFMTIMVPLHAAVGWQSQFSTTAPAGQELRGFGRVETVYAGYQAGSRHAWVVTFRCENPAKAATVAGKFLADLSLSPDVAPVALRGLAVPALAVPGGAAFTGCVDGAEARVICAESAATLADFLQAS
ncbi:MAG TPA: hypothetical protein VGM23_12715, partial [Armatimonadota bacterium]